jgi:DNA primase
MKKPASLYQKERLKELAQQIREGEITESEYEDAVDTILGLSKVKRFDAVDLHPHPDEPNYD